MKLIDADEAFRVLSDYYHHRTETQADALREALERVPEAVVRCKDCRHWRDDNPRVNGYHCCYRMHNIFPMKES
ncbi:MAG: hypothetical protein IIY28_06750, partial [Lachnospiraceae bacterium]|nr:hypothetical protein [Lachnospiraceae bacterium]